MSRIIFRESATPPTGIASGQMFLFSDADGDLSWTDDSNRVVTISKVDTGAGTTTFTIPSGGGTAAALAGAQTFTGQKTFNEDIVMAATKGIVFGSISGSATSVTLSRYEEGTWTPAWSFSTSGSATLASGYNTGKYTRIGNIVYISCAVRTSSISSPSGNVLLTGLPFAVATPAEVNGGSITIGYIRNWQTDMPNLKVLAFAGTSSLWFGKQASNAGDVRLQGSDFASGANSNTLYVSGFYYV